MKNPRVVLAVVILAVSFGAVAWRVGAFSSGPIRPASSTAQVLTRNDAAPEFEGLGPWFNGEPTTLAALRGKVVVIDFWTYSCINCIRTIPELRTLYQTYKQSGVELISIHAPEFDFEKLPANVSRAVVDKNVTWPVAMDNGFKTWRRFRNHYWPHVYVIDQRGRIRFDHIGEGGGRQIEAAVRELLRTTGQPLPAPSHEDVEEPSRGITPEIYLGYERGESFIGNADGYVRDKPFVYAVPSADKVRARGPAAFYLAGSWKAGKEAVVAGNAGARIVLPFTAQKVFIVAGSRTGSTGVKVLLDGKPISAESSDKDVSGGILTLGARDLYRIVSLTAVESHELTLVFSDVGASAYAFTFG